MNKKVQRYCEMELKNVTKHHWPAQPALERAYGAIMYAINFESKEFDVETAKYWEDEMLPKFRKAVLEEKR